MYHWIQIEHTNYMYTNWNTHYLCSLLDALNTWYVQLAFIYLTTVIQRSIQLFNKYKVKFFVSKC